MSNENIEQNQGDGLIANTAPQEEQQAPNPEESYVPHLEDDNKDQTVEQAKAEEEKKVFLSHFLQKKRVNLISLNTRKTQTFNQTHWSRTRNSKQKGRRSNSHCNNEHKTDNTKATF